eukprot:Rmarinus@m.13056
MSFLSLLRQGVQPEVFSSLKIVIHEEIELVWRSGKRTASQLGEFAAVIGPYGSAACYFLSRWMEHLTVEACYPLMDDFFLYEIPVDPKERHMDSDPPCMVRCDVVICGHVTPLVVSHSRQRVIDGGLRRIRAVVDAHRENEFETARQSVLSILLCSPFRRFGPSEMRHVDSLVDQYLRSGLPPEVSLEEHTSSLREHLYVFSGREYFLKRILLAWHDALYPPALRPYPEYLRRMEETMKPDVDLMGDLDLSCISECNSGATTVGRKQFDCHRCDSARPTGEIQSTHAPINQEGVSARNNVCIGNGSETCRSVGLRDGTSGSDRKGSDRSDVCAGKSVRGDGDDAHGCGNVDIVDQALAEACLDMLRCAVMVPLPSEVLSSRTQLLTREARARLPRKLRKHVKIIADDFRLIARVVSSLSLPSNYGVHLLLPSCFGHVSTGTHFTPSSGASAKLHRSNVAVRSRPLLEQDVFDALIEDVTWEAACDVLVDTFASMSMTSKTATPPRPGNGSTSGPIADNLRRCDTWIARHQVIRDACSRSDRLSDTRDAVPWVCASGPKSPNRKETPKAVEERSCLLQPKTTWQSNDYTEDPSPAGTGKSQPHRFPSERPDIFPTEDPGCSPDMLNRDFHPTTATLDRVEKPQKLDSIAHTPPSEDVHLRVEPHSTATGIAPRGATESLPCNPCPTLGEDYFIEDRRSTGHTTRRVRASLKPTVLTAVGAQPFDPGNDGLSVSTFRRKSALHNTSRSNLSQPSSSCVPTTDTSVSFQPTSSCVPTTDISVSSPTLIGEHQISNEQMVEPTCVANGSVPCESSSRGHGVVHYAGPVRSAPTEAPSYTGRLSEVSDLIGVPPPPFDKAGTNNRRTQVKTGSMQRTEESSFHKVPHLRSPKAQIQEQPRMIPLPRSQITHPQNSSPEQLSITPHLQRNTVPTGCVAGPSPSPINSHTHQSPGMQTTNLAAQTQPQTHHTYIHSPRVYKPIQPQPSLEFFQQTPQSPQGRSTATPPPSAASQLQGEGTRQPGASHDGCQLSTERDDSLLRPGTVMQDCPSSAQKPFSTDNDSHLHRGSPTRFGTENSGISACEIIEERVFSPQAHYGRPVSVVVPSLPFATERRVGNKHCAGASAPSPIPSCPDDYALEADCYPLPGNVQSMQPRLPPQPPQSYQPQPTQRRSMSAPREKHSRAKSGSGRSRVGEYSMTSRRSKSVGRTFTFRISGPSELFLRQMQHMNDVYHYFDSVRRVEARRMASSTKLHLTPGLKVERTCQI